MTTPLSNVTNQTPLPLTQPDTSPSSIAERSFADYLNSTVDQVAKSEKASNQAIAALDTGQAKNLHQVMLAVSEADISMHMLVQIRNKALDAYNTIMGMQI